MLSLCGYVGVVGSSLQRLFLHAPGIHDCGTVGQGESACYTPVGTVMPGTLLESIRTAPGAGATTSDIDGRDPQALSRPDFLIEVEVTAVTTER